MWSICSWFYGISLVVFIPTAALSTPVTNSFNANLRDYSEKGVNSTNIKTLQKESTGRYASFAPVRDPVSFKDVPDNTISSSSYGRGLVHREHPEYPSHDYDDHPHHGYGYGYVPHHEPDHDFGPYDHHDGHHIGHHGGYGYHHKHYDHGLATKALLWPIAGIALLGAAAALVSNPILLQLGVVSGRRRRDTEEASDLDFNVDSLTKWSKDDSNGKFKVKEESSGISKKNMKRRGLKEMQEAITRAYPISPAHSHRVTVDGPKQNHLDDEKLIPIPLKIKSN